MVTHDPKAAEYASRQVHLDKGALLDETRVGGVKYFPLLWAGLWRKKTRTILTLLSVVIAFLLFGLLQGVNAWLSNAVKESRASRLYTVSKHQLHRADAGVLPAADRERAGRRRPWRPTTGSAATTATRRTPS